MNNLFSYIYRYILLIVAVVTMGSCSKDSEGEAVVFPEKQVLDTKAGKDETFTFAAPADNWELISEQPVWCRLTYGEQKALPSVVGNSGNVTVTVNISDDMASFVEKTTSDLTLRIGSQEQVIATIVRADVETYVVLKQNGEVIPSGGEVKIGTTGEASFTIETNFGTPDMSYSDWFDVTVDNGTYTLMLKDDVSQKYPKSADEGYINFAMSGSNAIKSHSYKVSFTGMDPQTVKVTGYKYTSSLGITYKLSAFGWDVSEDGKTFSLTRANGDIVTVQNAVLVTVDALNDGLVFAYIADNKFIKLTGNEWFHVTQDKSDVKISANALPSSTSARSTAIYAFSTEKWESVKNVTITNDALYTSNAVLSFTQKKASTGFDVTYYDWNDYEMKSLTTSKETSQATLEKVRSCEPTATEVYKVSAAGIPVNTYTKNKSLTAGALLKQNEWDSGSTTRNFKLIDLTTGENMTEKTGYSIDPGMDTGNNWQFDVAFPGTMSDPLLLVMYDTTGKSVIKALIINNN